MISLTCGKASLLVTLCELDVKIRDQSVDVVVALNLQAEGRAERQVLWLHSVNVHFLGKNAKCYFCDVVVLFPCNVGIAAQFSAIADQNPKMSPPTRHLSHTCGTCICQSRLIIHHDFCACVSLCV